MDEQAKEEIVDRIDPEKGFDKEINRVLGQNESLRKSPEWDGATAQQKRELRTRLSSTERYESAKFERQDKTYIRVDENNYKKVTSNDDVLVTDDGRVFLRDENGRIREAV